MHARFLQIAKGVSIEPVHRRSIEPLKSTPN